MHVVLACVAKMDDGTWLLGGDLDISTIGDAPVGSRLAVVVRDGSPQAFDLWYEGAGAPAADCAGFLASIKDPERQPATGGELNLPN